ncbi:DUF2243 domain-containing protein [Azospirillum soli]|uniref:DUF2243 domain-containing protein n=1 Tax=Azospirillum soli TaxID=1304799 RepID=UPI001AE9B1CC|nr:DUF2243 domain-containing protein [Azospirillum soli]MBP2312853.1 putative membrane protein [Azospirillum soli]
MSPNPDLPPSGRLTWAGVWLGLSLGGFFDGIMLHQVLQWHHMLTSVPDPAVRDDITLNTFADGLFHVACWLFLVIGLWVLWRARGEFGALHWARTFVGGILIGAGAFNLIEGLVNHQILGIHHVRTGSPNELLWDLGFLASGVVLIGVGWSVRPRRRL